MTIEGIQYTPDQSDSHETLSTRQGWSVAAMRQEIDALTRQLNMHQSRIGNALNLLRLVNCGNLDQAKVRQAILVLEDIDKRRNAI